MTEATTGGTAIVAMLEAEHGRLTAQPGYDSQRTIWLTDLIARARTITEAASQPREGEVERIEAECARLLAAYITKEIGILMHQAEHWAANGKPLAVHHRLMKADDYFQIRCLMERDPAKGWKLPFDEIREALERPEIKAPGTYPPSKDLYRYRDPRFVAAALTQRPPEQAGAVPAGMKAWQGGPCAPLDASDPVVILTRGDSFTCMAKRAVHWQYGTYIHEIGEPMPPDCDVIAYTPKPAAPTPPDAGPGEIPAGMVAWSGGVIAPDDWDGGDVLLKGHSRPCFVTSWRGQMGDPEIIAYTPKAPPQTPPDAGIGSDGTGERV